MVIWHKDFTKQVIEKIAMTLEEKYAKVDVLLAKLIGYLVRLSW